MDGVTSLKEYAVVSVPRLEDLIRTQHKLEERIGELERYIDGIEKPLMEAYKKDHAYGWVSVRTEVIKQILQLEEVDKDDE